MNEATVLKKENKKLEKTLPQNIQQEYFEMINYLRSYKIEAVENELIRRNIYNLVSKGLEEGKTFHQIIGDDYHLFIDEVAKKTPQNNLPERFVCLFLFTQLIYIFMRNWILNMSSNADTFESISLNAGDAITAVVLIAACYFLLENIYTSIYNNQMLKTILKVTIFVCLVVGLQIAGFMIQLPSINIPTFVFYVVTIVVGCIAMQKYKGHKK